ncbi:dipeptidase PepV [Streptococcus pluranimalium]|uniref:dipeptidase PepV n=1 Tax=Streptococcus pluranimalium TaxID=82348 RepID=UPI0039FBC243
MVDWLEEVRKKQSDLLQILEGLLCIPSVRDDNLATQDCPVGPGPKAALLECQDIAERIGLQTEVFGNVILEANWGNQSEILAILGHVDVVPVGEGWTSDPFLPYYRDGKLYARGVLDDKGPLVCVIFAVALLKELGFEPRKQVRFIIGSDEESDWKCLKYYQTVRKLPKVGFVPDAYFPIVNGEKGNGVLSFSIADNHSVESALTLVSFEAGERLNMVPSQASAIIETEYTDGLKQVFDDFLEKNREVTGILSCEEDVVNVTLYGKSAHASKPDKGVNAATYLAVFLNHYHFSSEKANVFIECLAKLHKDYFGEGLGIAFSSKEMGPLTINPGIINYQDGVINCDMRYPKEVNPEEACRNLRIDKDVRVDFTEKLAPHYVKLSSDLVKTLMKVYQKQTRTCSKSLVIGGATYARLLEEGVAFGALFPESDDTMHQANESIQVEDLLRATAIYAEALYELVVVC